MFKTKYILVLTACLCLFTITAKSAAGDLDPTFGPVGFFTTSLSTGHDVANSVLRQADGKFVVVGTRNQNINSSIALARYNPNGMLDVSFDGDGIVATPINSSSSEGVAATLQPDGKIVVIGTTFISGTIYYVVVRYNSDGSLDPTFDGDGIFTENRATVGSPRAVAIQPDGKIVIAGNKTGEFNFGSDFSIVRLNSNGSYDASFDGDGRVLVSAGDPQTGGEDFTNALALQPDGKILIGGQSNFLSTGYDFSLLRLNSDGSLDTSFDGDGKVRTTFGENGQGEGISSIFVLPDGKILAAGTGNEGSVRGFALARYNSDGSLDTTLSGDGKVVTQISNNSSESIRAAVLQPDGKIVVAGYSVLQFLVARFNPDGTFDNSFSNDGKAFTTIYETGSSQANSLILEANGKIIAVGTSTIGGNSIDGDFAIARYNPDGTPSTDFGVFGRVSTNLFNYSSEANAVAITSDGKILAAGTLQSNVETNGLIVRYTPDGRLDSTFASSTQGSGSTGVHIPGGQEHQLNAIVVQPDGKFLVTGSYEGLSDAGLFLVRFNSNGTRDLQFGGNNNGFSIISALNKGGIGQDIALLPDGKILVTGAAANLAAQKFDFGLYRFNANGTLDTAFGNNGIAAISLSSGEDVPFSIVVQPDGKTILAGARNLNENADTDIALVRFNANGTIDTTFGSNGSVINNLGGFPDVATAMRLQTDGKLIIAGVNCLNNNCSTSNIALLRYNSDGSLDNGFDSDGIVIAQISGSTNSGASDLVLQRNGKIIISGETVNPNAQSDAFVGRFNPNGSLDATFNDDGFAITDHNSQETANALALQPDGKIVTAGAILVGTRRDITVWRYLNDENNVPRQTQFDYDGDGRADVSVFRPSVGGWYISRSSNNAFFGASFGQNGDLIAPADFDGDGKTDISVFRRGFWYRINSSNNQFVGLQFGIAEDIPVPADYDGDGKADIAVFRQSNGTWYRSNSSDNQFVAFKWGTNGDKPVIGDFDGDGKADYAVFRASSGGWYIQKSRDNSFYAVNFGLSEDIPTAADYDGDGKTDISVFRPSVGSWYRLNSSTNQFFGQQFGITEDKPVAADYDGDGRADLAVFRPSAGAWYIQRSNSGFFAQQFGADGDIPTPFGFKQ